MSDLVERYLYQVGRYLPKAERAEIQAELRSLIQDQLDHRGQGSASVQDVAAVLQALGSPLKMARSYGAEQYLVGPTLYPAMRRVLRTGLYVIPLVVVVVKVIVALTATNPTLVGLFFDVVFTSVQALLVFIGVLVGIFALLERSDTDLSQFKEKTWNPLDLPATVEAGKVQDEVATDLAGNVFALLILLYFLVVGGLTLNFNLADPGDVIPVPLAWLLTVIGAHLGRIGVIVLVLRRGRWSLGAALGFTLLDVISAVGGYFVIARPGYDLLVGALPWLTTIPLISWGPIAISAFVVLLGLLGGLDRLIKLGVFRTDQASPPPFNIPTTGSR